VSSADLPSSQDSRIEEAFGEPVTRLYAQAMAGSADPGVQKALELRSFLAVVEDQAVRTRDSIHQATDPAGELHAVSGADLRFDVRFLEATLKSAGKYIETLDELIRDVKAQPTPDRKRVRFEQPVIRALALPGGEPTTKPSTAAATPQPDSGGHHHRR
jgi:hypothetical protein